MKKTNVLLLMMLTCVMSAPGFGEEPEETSVKKTTTQNVGGLLFDVDEGVKVEQGPGGSVYLKSNREFMQEKFSEIERKLEQLHLRLVRLETGKAALPSPLPAEENKDARQVLVA
jgi:hypothetical protein